MRICGNTRSGRGAFDLYAPRIPRGICRLNKTFLKKLADRACFLRSGVLFLAFIYSYYPFFLAISAKIVYNTVWVKYMITLFSCPIYRIFGIPCPTCGVTRAYILFFSGRFYEAFLMHPLFLLPLIFLFPKMRRKRIVISVIGIFLAVYIIRFLLLFPTTPPFNFNENSIIGGIL